MSNSLWPHGLYSPWNSLGQNSEVGCLSLLQGDLSSQPRDQTQVSCIAGIFFTSWATREIAVNIEIRCWFYAVFSTTKHFTTYMLQSMGLWRGDWTTWIYQIYQTYQCVMKKSVFITHRVGQISNAKTIHSDSFGQKPWTLIDVQCLWGQLG